ncbi:RNA polymerase sigma factor [Mucilaginibacter sp. SP1R1]|uniref:RNA polymerase sigma factor n=1 Tax=Mucilaginibacter sp. SP1R1 TaxID=2723091 RepID=UPI0016183EC5|nr:sigma-70 family RNA polymerase sigma factor [Mucilaginibacter sp. SP1R1]MBB6150333.1 RNA polymerase sigma-70 factor (ECF subfamily) [Mucilaginibacter sp. SP1R1]
MHNGELIPHLFRTEYRKIVSVLCKRFGFDQIETAEDIASETFLTAAQDWGIKGLPPNPAAWLYNVAKNKAKNHLQRSNLFENKIAAELKNTLTDVTEIDLSPQNINDSQLQMMFAVCHPIIPPEAQIGLSLRILCGFGIEEIASAFLTNKETINKRLFRAKEKLRAEKIKIELPDETEIDERLTPVLTTIYLLFNEGYYSASQNKTLRKELCLEAMRLCTMLVENNNTNKPQVNALLALMCFHASRFEARLDKNGELVLYQEQDTTLWNADLISKGGYFLNCAASGNRLSKYHLEAGIAYWNTQQSDTQEKWENILQLYNHLLQIAYSPIAALNRTYALSKANGKQAAIAEAEKLNLTSDHFYFMLLGELYTETDHQQAFENFKQALSLAKTLAEKQAIQKKIDKLG